MTEAAEALQRASHDIFGRLESLDMQLSDMQGSLQGQLKLAVESSAKYFVPHLFGAFKRQHPEVNLQLTVVNRAQALGAFRTPRRLGDHVHGGPQDNGLEFMLFSTTRLSPGAARSSAIVTLAALAPARFGNLHPTGAGAWVRGPRLACEEYFKEKRVHFGQTWRCHRPEAQARMPVFVWSMLTYFDIIDVSLFF
ncbi:hypothetical protein FQR65_LT18894 [Abscondita terminalis]|nr:hypothetical protein FQR65_LT18894 [Abscondita terminalis]